MGYLFSSRESLYLLYIFIMLTFSACELGEDLQRRLNVQNHKDKTMHRGNRNKDKEDRGQGGKRAPPTTSNPKKKKNNTSHDEGNNDDDGSDGERDREPKKQFTHTKTATMYCAFCKLKYLHWSSDCQEFPNLASRMSIVQARGLCGRCLGKRHNPCTSKKLCFHCVRAHLRGADNHHNSLCPVRYK